MRRLLFVSTYYASDFSVAVWGVFQRMRMLLQAAEASADALDILFFVDQRVIDKLGPGVSQASLKAHWGIDATVHLALRASKTRGRLSSIFWATLGMRNRNEFVKTGGAAQAKAVASCVQADTALIVCHRLDGAIAATAAKRSGIPIVMDLDDIEHVAFMRKLVRPPHSIKKSIRFFEMPALFAGEIAIIKACRATFVCSEADRTYLRRWSGDANIVVISNAVEFPSDQDSMVSVAGEGSETLLFLGTYIYEPNVEAAEHLIHDIFPRIVAKRSSARLLIAGNAVERLPSFQHAPPGVEFIGFVSDLTEIYRRVAVVCCPIRSGGGTRIKIIEAAARRKPVVSTRIGAEGLIFEDGREILVRDRVQDFADACVELLADPDRAASIGEASCRKAKSAYARSGVIDEIVASFRAAAAPRDSAK